MLQYILYFLICLFLYYIVKHYWISHKSPPGPHGLPFLGVLPYVVWKGISTGKEVSIIKFVTEIGNQYGTNGVISMNFGTLRFVYLHTYDAIKEAFVERASDFSDRQQFFFTVIFGKPPTGIIQTDGQLWKVHRRFATMVLRNLGFGKTVLEEKIIEESKLLVERIRQAPNGQVNTLNYFVRSVGNIISQLLIGTRWNEAEFDHLNEQVKISTQGGSIGQLLLFFFPQFAKTGIIQFLFPSTNIIIQANKNIEKLMETKFEDINERYDGVSEPCCYVEYFIQESQQENAAQKAFHREQGVGCMADLFIAGTDTTTNALAWGMIYLAKHSKIMQKLQEEIDLTIQAKFDKGAVRSLDDVQLMYSDRNSMPYINAVMDEIQRCSSIASAGVQHAAKNNVTFRGYRIDSTDLIMFNIYHVHHDPQLWGDDVDIFRPERFLDGQVYKPSKYLIPFGIGKRSCLGETLARTEFFQFLSSLCRHFDVKLSPNNKFTYDELIDGGSNGVVRAPADHEIIFIPRSFKG